MSFATLLAQLVDRLTQLAPDAPAHLQRLVIRVDRAKRQVEQCGRSDGLDSLVRLRGRLEELELGLEELENLRGSDESKWLALKRQVERARQLIARELANAESSVVALRHSRSSSSASASAAVDLPRRTRHPPTRPPSTPPSLDAFLSRLEPANRSVRSTTNSPLVDAQERAKSLSEAYSLFLLSTSPSSVLPKSESLSSIFQHAAAAKPFPSSSSSLAIPPSSGGLSDQRVDDLAVALSSTSSARQTWVTLARLLADACLPLIPGRASQSKIKRRIDDLLLGSPAGMSNEAVEAKQAEWTLEEGFDAVDEAIQVLKKLYRTNVIPPIFYSTSPRLFQVQNKLQALTIIACLHTIVLTTSRSLATVQPTSSENLTSRLWTILESEIPAHPSPSDSSSSSSPPAIPTRLAHLSDEIISHLSDPASTSTLPRTSPFALEDSVQAEVRSAVDRVLRYRDPVFALLQNRLRDGIERGVVETLTRRGDAPEHTTTRGTRVPDKLYSGRRVPPRGEAAHERRTTEVEIPTIKGYEALRRQIEQTVNVELVPVWEWVEYVWSEVLGWNDA
ncbi:hypothetical protein JCM11491_001065 [Sporobolomyces phaffii]